MPMVIPMVAMAPIPVYLLRRLFSGTHGAIFHGKRVAVGSYAYWGAWPRTSYHLSTPICQFFTPSALPAYNESGWHHSTYDDAAWPSGYAGVGRQYCVRPAHAAAPSPVTPHTRC